MIFISWVSGNVTYAVVVVAPGIQVDPDTSIVRTLKSYRCVHSYVFFCLVFATQT